MVNWRKNIPISVLVLFLLLQLPRQVTGFETFFGNVFRFQGWWLYFLLAVFALVVDRKKVYFEGYLPFLYIIGLAVAGFLMPGNESGRAIGTIGEPNMLAAAVIFVWPWILKKINLGTVLGIIGTLSILWITVSRSALTALVLQIIILLIYRSSKNLRLAVFTTFLGLAAAFLLPGISSQRVWENRSEIWQTAIFAGWRKPIFGWGFGSVGKSISEEAVLLSNNLRYMYVDSAHNIWLDWWIQGGVTGLAILVWICVSALGNMSKKFAYIEAMSFVGILTCLSFNPGSIVSLVQFWLLAGMWGVKGKVDR